MPEEIEFEVGWKDKSGETHYDTYEALDSSQAVDLCHEEYGDEVASIVGVAELA